MKFIFLIFNLVVHADDEENIFFEERTSSTSSPRFEFTSPVTELPTDFGVTVRHERETCADDDSESAICSETCGGGTRSCTKPCGNGSSTCTMRITESCNEHNCGEEPSLGIRNVGRSHNGVEHEVDICDLTSATCSESCGNGIKACRRNCFDSSSESCVIEKSENCNGHACPIWAGCTVVVECSASCYPGGIRTCDKTCENGSKGDKGCEPEGERTEESCNEHSCPGVFPSFVTACPDTVCWTLSPESHECQLQSECHTLHCEPKHIAVVYPTNILGGGRQWTPENLPQAKGTNEVYPDAEFVTYCEFGQCGMTMEILDSKMMATIELKHRKSDGTDVPFTSFTCSYDLSIKIGREMGEASEIAIESNGAVKQLGNLSSGFILDIGGSAFLGETKTVTITWDVLYTDKVRFHATDCSISTASYTVPLIKNACGAQVFLVTKKETTDMIKHYDFTFTSFLLSGHENFSHNLACTVYLCNEDDVSCGPDSAVCSTDFDDRVYDFVKF